MIGFEEMSEFNRYLQLKAQYVHHDYRGYHRPEKYKIIDETRDIKLRACEQKKDFGKNLKTRRIFHSAEGKKICLDNTDDIQLENIPFGTFHFRFLYISIERCQGPSCETDQGKIDQYISNLKIDAYVLQERINF